MPRVKKACRDVEAVGMGWDGMAGVGLCEGIPSVGVG